MFFFTFCTPIAKRRVNISFKAHLGDMPTEGGAAPKKASEGGGQGSPSEGVLSFTQEQLSPFPHNHAVACSL
jgi:hypothetical protein